MDRWLLVGLGNPGSEYAGTRHNIGFAVAEELARRWGIDLGRKQFGGRLGTGELAGSPVVLLLPQGYMNLSGRSVGPAAGFLQIPPQRLVVLHDEIDLPLGRLRVKEGGGHGGHNGLRSIVEVLGRADFLRVRLGVGRPEQGEVTGHVLSRFTAAQQQEATQLVERAADATEEIVRLGVRAAMNHFNGTPGTTAPPADGA